MKGVKKERKKTENITKISKKRLEEIRNQRKTNRKKTYKRKYVLGKKQIRKSDLETMHCLPKKERTKDKHNERVRKR